MTYQEIYTDLLRLVRQYATATLYPNEFNTLWNKEMLNWVQLRASEDEMNDKRNQDLQKLKVIDIISNSGNPVAGEEVFLIPYSPSFVNTTGNPGSINYGFLRLENVSVKGTYNECDVKKALNWKSITPWIKDDTKNIENNPFRVPMVSEGFYEIYYEIRDFRIYIHAGDDFVATSLRIEYLRYPQMADVANSPSMVAELPIYALDEIKSRVRSEFLARNGSPLYQASLAQQKTTVN
jgi:hypothetical protein